MQGSLSWSEVEEVERMGDVLTAMDDMVTLRDVTDRDADDLIALVGDAYAEYPGCVLDLGASHSGRAGVGLDADLLAPATAIDEAGGRWWVIEEAGRVVGSIAAAPHDEGQVELQRLYVAATHRRRGLAVRLVAEVEAHAHRLGARRVVLWTDSRFLPAHRFYTRLGYVATGATRELHDLSNTTELEFVREV